MGFTGVGRYVEQLIVGLGPRQVEWSIITNRFAELLNSSDTLRGNSSLPPILTGGKHKWPTFWWLDQSFPGLAMYARAQLAHFPTGRAPSHCPLRYVLTVHDLTILEQRKLYPFLERLLVAPRLHRSIQHAAAIIAVSHDTADALARRYSGLSCPVHVIHEAVAQEFFESAKRKPAQAESAQRRVIAHIRAEYGLDQRFWLHVGSITTRKNLARLVDAFAIARQCVTGEPPQLVLAGPAGDAIDAVRARIKVHGLGDAVKVTGYVPADHLPSLYQMAELVVVPSLHEGFGFPALEAMASGTPVVSSGRGALAEVAGDAAYVVDPENVEHLAGAIVRVAVDDELRTIMIRRGMDRAAQFTVERMARSTLTVYRSVISSA